MDESDEADGVREGTKGSDFGRVRDGNIRIVVVVVVISLEQTVSTSRQSSAA